MDRIQFTMLWLDEEYQADLNSNMDRIQFIDPAPKYFFISI